MQDNYQEMLAQPEADRYEALPDELRPLAVPRP